MGCKRLWLLCWVLLAATHARESTTKDGNTMHAVRAREGARTGTREAEAEDDASIITTVTTAKEERHHRLQHMSELLRKHPFVSPMAARSLAKLVRMEPEEEFKNKKPTALVFKEDLGKGSTVMSRLNLVKNPVLFPTCDKGEEEGARHAITALGLSVFLGLLGADRFYYSYLRLGAAKLFLTLGPVVCCLPSYVRRPREGSKGEHKAAKIAWALVAICAFAWWIADIILVATYGMGPQTGCLVKDI